MRNFASNCKTNIPMPQAQHTHTATDTASYAADTTAHKVLGQWTATGFPTPKLTDSVSAYIEQLPVVEPPTATATHHTKEGVLSDALAISLLMLSFSALLLCLRGAQRYIGNLLHNLISVRRQESLFDDHTVNEVGVITALSINTCIVVAFFIYFSQPQMHEFSLPGVAIGITALSVGAIFGTQLLLLQTLGYVFAERVGTSLLVRGYGASLALLGVVTLPLCVVMVTYQNVAPQCIIAASVAYLIFRIIFVIKGFRIFYTDLYTIFYFILYLCSVEIAFPIISAKWAISVLKILQ